jgi:putative intracellular protease/amidase
MRILIMLSAGADSQAGVVQEYLIEAYYLFSDAGFEIVIAAPGGGSACLSIRAKSDLDDTAETEALRQRYIDDRRARDVMNDLVCVADVCAQDFDAALCLGSPALDRCAEDKDDVTTVINQLLTAAKPVALIGEPSACTAEARNGLLMIGRSSESLRLAATALLGATNLP